MNSMSHRTLPLLAYQETAACIAAAPATPPSGLKWERIDARVAAEGTPLVCDNLTEALGRRSQSRDVSFSEAEWAAFGVSKPLRATHFVAAGDAYFRPVPPASPSPLPPPPVQTQYSTASSVGPDAGRGGLSAFFFGGGVGAGGATTWTAAAAEAEEQQRAAAARDRKPNGLIGHFNEMLYLDVSAVDETIKVPMLADVLRIVAEVHGLEYTRRPEHDPEIMSCCRLRHQAGLEAATTAMRAPRRPALTARRCLSLPLAPHSWSLTPRPKAPRGR